MSTLRFKEDLSYRRRRRKVVLAITTCIGFLVLAANYIAVRMGIFDSVLGWIFALLVVAYVIYDLFVWKRHAERPPSELLLTSDGLRFSGSMFTLRFEEMVKVETRPDRLVIRTVHKRKIKLVGFEKLNSLGPKLEARLQCS